MNLTLQPIDFAALSPLLIVLAGALIQLLVESFAETQAKKYSFFLAAITLLIAIYSAIVAPASQNPLLSHWIRFDHLTQFLNVFFLSVGLMTTLLSYAFFKRVEATRGEYYFFLFSCLFGLMLIGASADFLTLFLGLETLSIALYVLCGYIKEWKVSHEAAIKYFLTGAFAAAILLYGIALIYGAVGTTQFSQLSSSYQKLDLETHRTLFLVGIGFVTIGLAFKAAIVPFHVWAPDVYDGAPTPVTAFMAVGTKVGAFAAFIRIFFDALPNFDPLWNVTIALLAYPTLIYANFVAMRQTQLRRFFAYSGISHAGFLLIPLAANTPDALTALLFYLVIYAFATLGAFGIMAYLEQRPGGVMLRDLQGLFYRSPFVAVIFTLCLLTLAGIPPTAGFFAKFYIFKVGLQAGYLSLVIVGVFTTIFSAYYYLRIVTIMLTPSAEDTIIQTRSRAAMTVGVVACIALIILSCYPNPLLHVIGLIG